VALGGGSSSGGGGTMQTIGGIAVTVVTNADIPVHIINRVVNPPAPVANAVRRRGGQHARQGQGAHQAFLAATGKQISSRQDDDPFDGGQPLALVTPSSFVATGGDGETAEPGTDGPCGRDMYQLTQATPRKRKADEKPATPMAAKNRRRTAAATEEEDPNEVG